MCDAQLRMIITSKKRMVSEKIVAKLQKLAAIEVSEISKYYKGGFEDKTTIKIPDDTWSEMVLYTINIVQGFGYAWTLSGNISEAIEISSSRFTIQGIEHAALFLENDKN